VRIALLSPYSWTYPGGVTRHIEALSGALAEIGHETTVLAPFDPDDSLSRRLHRGARPQASAMPENLISLGRTVGLPANGAVSNMALTPHAVFTLRQALRGGGYDVVHIHEPVVPVVSWDALCSVDGVPLVGTFHTYSENRLTNGVAAGPLGGRRRMNRLHARIAVSEAAAWTARRFFGGRYRIIPNGVHIESLDCGLTGPGATASIDPDSAEESLAPRILFIGQAVERKGLSVLLRAFEALREHVPAATLTLVGPSTEEVAHMMLDDRGVTALGKVSEERKLAELARAEILCAPSLHGESFGMVLTEAFAAATPVVASDIPGYRDVVRDGVDGVLSPPGDPVRLAAALHRLSLDERSRARMALHARERAERYAWPHVAREVLDSYEQAIDTAARARQLGSRPLSYAAKRYGLMPVDLLPRIPAQRLASLKGDPPPRELARGRVALARRVALVTSSLAAGALAALALQRVGVASVAASLVASKPGLIGAGLGLMCLAMFLRALGWHAILIAAPTWRPVKRRDAMQGTFIGVLMSATLPARLGEPSRAMILSRRLGRARETLPVVLGTMVSQTLLNLLALTVLGCVTLSNVSVLDGLSDGALVLVALGPFLALMAVLAAPLVIPTAAVSRSRRLAQGLTAMRRSLLHLRKGLSLFRHPRAALIASSAQLGAWALQWLSCWLLLKALGLDSHAGVGAAAAVLFAVNITALVPATPANIGVFQIACVVVLAGAYHVSTADAIAYGIVLQVVELTTALIMGLPALVNEGLSWRDVRLRTLNAAPVRLTPLPDGARALAHFDR
jgi:phosphatidylinositol alpha-mannosyltransferase